MNEEFDFNDLKPEWRIFCENYVIAWNGTQSYMVAYPNSSYESAMSSSSDLLRNPKVKAYIEHIQKDLAKLANVSALRNVLELKKIAYTNLSDFKDGWMTERDFDSLTEDQKGALSEIVYVDKMFNGNSEKVVKFKVHDKMKAIEMINKMLGFNLADKLDLTTGGESLNLSKEERAIRIASLKRKMNE
ncbi:terminase small subunit [Cellulophaga phage Nekkels_1]|uniref:Terminase small subunit n=1 Tax=Cellulophaga phage Nekkels_1 TaxID=2745692 RepID=A0A8E4XXQ3_9CAUD|nr:terminase small subunit [Cellulophaga phage Nekkels_1]QQO97023.1 terminase small subunit [Cellulophaga phage Nekkels_1]QQO97116.1 terminase small subunit [Cellulophaga phage Nekkels_2]